MAPWRTAEEGCPILAISTPPKSRIISPHQALRASFPLRGKPCREPCSEQLSVQGKIPRLTLGMTRKNSIKFSRKQNHAFAPAHLICCKALAGKVNLRGVYKREPSKTRRRGKLRLRRPKGGQWGLPQITEKRRRQLAEIFVNRL